jgi:hypothetical protein
MRATAERVSVRLAILVARLVMIVMAAGIAYLGFAVLTTAWAIPLTVGLWLGAAAILGLGLFDDLRRRAHA